MQTTAFKRLTDETRELATRGLSGEWGKALKPIDMKLDDLINTAGLSENMKCALAIRLLAERAPLRIEKTERLVGSASVLDACYHTVPIYGGQSVSHVTLAFDRVMKEGLKGLRSRIDERLSRPIDEDGQDLLNAMRICAESMATWVERYRQAVLSDADLKCRGRILANLDVVPENPPQSFEQAVQSLWLLFAFNRLCGNWSAIGRIDQMLGPYLQNDLAQGIIDRDEARELLAHFWIKGTEWIGAGCVHVGSGDAQFYQNIVLAGVDQDGKEVANEVTELVLEVVEELRISDFPISVRVNNQTPRELLYKIASVQRQGNGIVAVYGEDVVIESLVKFGYPAEVARTFANDGCWEALIPGQTGFMYRPKDAVEAMQIAIGVRSESTPDFSSFEDVYQAVLNEMSLVLDRHHEEADRFWYEGHSVPLVSLFIDDCIETGRGYYHGGPRYKVFAPHFGGLANASNSLLAIKKLVYEDRLLSIDEYVQILRNNWQGHEELRKRVLNTVPTYGNDDPEADAMMQRLFDDYTAMAAQCRERVGVLRPAGISTFGREIDWAPYRGATADGHFKGDVLATNFSPSPGSDTKGPTAALNSYCKMDFTMLPNIGTLELKLWPESVKGEAGLDSIVGLLEGFIKQRGCFLHIDVVDSDLLRDAQLNPGKYPSLAVRISGWSARFATMDKRWQDMVINRTQQKV